MRSGAQITRTPREWLDHQQEERRRTLTALLAELRRAREAGAERYQRIADGRPPLSRAEYEAVASRGARRGRSERPARSS